MTKDLKAYQLRIISRLIGLFCLQNDIINIIGKKLLKADADILVKWIERMGVENERQNRNTVNKI